MSAILSADDLNDFISPGVACIKPIETLPKEDDSNPYEVTTEDKVQPHNAAPASISLTDCLACSGCVTSAEAVLVSLQSHTEVLNTLDAYPSLNVQSLIHRQNGVVNGHAAPPPDGKVFVASVSPQVRASLAATYGISERKAGFMIEQFLSGSQGLRIGGQHKNGFTYVIDTNQAREACLVLGAEEVADSIHDKSRSKPILTSACPGWICYAEKTHPHILPHLSTLKSPQALSGTLLKSVLSRTLGIHPSQIWHLAIMPCFDKKLEASREELTDRWWHESADTSSPAIRDVDCVITSRELLSLASARGIQMSDLPLKPLSPSERTPFPDPRISYFLYPKSRQRREEQTANAGSSGGYLYHILLTEQASNPGSTISMQRGRNADVVEYALISSSGKPIMKCARYYGFRNIQNLVRKLKPAKQSKLPGAARRMTPSGGAGSASDYAYVEVMACPGGCTNGGGQIKVVDVADLLPQTRGEEVSNSASPQAQKEWLKRVDEAYYSADSEGESSCEDDQGDVPMTNGMNGHSSPTGRKEGQIINGVDTGNVHEFMNYWSGLIGVPISKLAHTSYREVESDVGKNKPNKMTDTERIASIAGLSGGALLRETSAVGVATSNPGTAETIRSLIRTRFHKDRKLLSQTQVANGLSAAHGYLGLLRQCAAKEPVAIQRLNSTLETVSRRAEELTRYRRETASRWKPPPPSRHAHLRNLRQIASPRSHVSGSLSDPSDTTPRIFSHPAPIESIKAGVRKVPNLILAQGIPVLKYSGPTPVLVNRVLKEKILWGVRKWEQHKSIQHTLAIAEWEDEWDRILADKAGIRDDDGDREGQRLNQRVQGTKIRFYELQRHENSWTTQLHEVDHSLKGAVMDRGKQYALLGDRYWHEVVVKERELKENERKEKKHERRMARKAASGVHDLAGEIFGQQGEELQPSSVSSGFI
ncbi:Cytosolic Fe-S cluster assembly factor nar1 [Cladophialophora chaetospira]|uniref:Cytosolic Fe-S cluster assembly factor NAR1 n=1 Tax=Cladophialophora chaetospira TaxID=386627 RepID=A0AA39CGL2_9EURO|nr:Cytosolic Fe-S cluster assembly factor nar1 [Cladophialophora chaetospira]